jgi:hypothetical protein
MSKEILRLSRRPLQEMDRASDLPLVFREGAPRLCRFPPPLHVTSETGHSEPDACGCEPEDTT